MKITICSHDGKGYFGGPYEWVKRFGPSLRDAGHEVSFLFFSDHTVKDSSTYNYLKNLRFKCDLLHAHGTNPYLRNTEDRVLWFLKKVKENPPDVFIANITLFAMFAGKWIKEAGIPVVGVIHSDDPRQEYIYQEFISGKNEFSFSGIVAVSSLLKEKVQKSNPNNIPVVAISCGAPIPAKKAFYSKTPFKIIYSGKITDYQKRITETVIGLCNVVKTLPGVEVDIYGAGSESEKIKNLILEIASDYPIHFKGFVSSDKIQGLFSEAQAFVLLSDFEGQPVALMEAMATGLVPICTNISSGIPELIINEESGLLINDRNSDLIAAVKRLLEDPILWKQISNNALNKAIGEYSIDATTKKWIDFLNELVIDVQKKTLAFPNKIILPPVNPLISDMDRRKPPLNAFIKGQFDRIMAFTKKKLSLLKS